MENLKGIEYLAKKLTLKRDRVLLRYAYYDEKDHRWNNSPVLPDRLKMTYRSELGWCTKAVDSLADRLVFSKFDNDNFGVNEIFNVNNPDVLFSSAILGALIGSCSFIYISPDANGSPRLQVIDGANATGIIDPITGLLTEGYAVLERDENCNPIVEAYFTPGETRYIYKEPRSVVTDIKKYPNIPFPLLVPVIYKADATRPFGHSRISRTCMDLQDKAKNILTRADITADFYSFPQKYVVGTSQELETLDSWRATISSMLRIDKDEDGDHPIMGQFQTASMTPHIEQLKTVASLFGGATGLTMTDLGFATENPSSAEAIKAGHEDLRLTARAAQKSFNVGLINTGYLATCLRDNIDYERQAFYDLIPVWQPIFEPDAAMLSSIGDGAIKINQAVPDYFTKENLEKLTGIKAE